ncbi:MAG: hypothetical protein KDK61_00305 [Simkania sp.]|nr:hypothetical protein [Simkania sp.]
MNLKDRLGNLVTTSETEVIDAIDHFTDQLLRLGAEIADITNAAERHPDNYLLQLYAALFYLYGQAEKPHEKARLFLQKAQALLAHHVSEREESFYEALHLWYQDHLSECLNHLEKHCLKWRNDLVALKATEFIYYCKGQQYEGKRFLALTDVYYPKWKDDPLFLSMHSFALELTGQLDAAEKEAIRALDLDKFNSWAHHTLCHVYINRGAIDKGIDALESYVPIWKKSGRLIESHNMWHLALMYLENLDFEESLDVVKRAKWESKVSMIGEEVDLASLLWRFDLEQQDVTTLWEGLANAIGEKAGFGSIPFVNAQLFYALKKGGKKDEVKEGLSSVLRFAELQRGEDQKVWKGIGLPLIYGALAFANQDYKTALKYFDPMIGEVGAVGGSDAQVDLFRQTYFKCLVGAKRRKDARAYLTQMTEGRSMTRLETKWFNESVS